MSLYQLEAFFGLGTKINEQHRPLLTPDEVRQLGADSVIIFSANVPPIPATRLDPLMLGNLEVKPQPLLPGLEGTPYALPKPKGTEPTVASEEPVLLMPPEEVGGARVEPEF